MSTHTWKLAAGVALLALCSAAAFAQAPDGAPQGPPPDAQSGPPPGGMGRMRGPEQQLKRLTQLLTLTADQQSGVKAVLDQQAAQMRALRQKSQGATPESDTPEARQARVTQMEQIRDESDTKIAALLDENQKKTFADWTQRRKAAMERRQSREGQPPPQGGEAPPPPPNR
jgi:protein CpxP